ncbi:ABC transporter permease [Burkholderia sp. WAC0059]|uniref:amino acid ABC transporter permease n=1 Tax=Burkholderia sp. WAC0059 TaxID=2066022 RepID=UPI000C7F5706|nr:amino acid ABC transporter permease [Burkholderia sp. WAC0059]PLZ02391.1 ABC transporter permease [Burkholderia sp. WAC0059]
MMPNSAYHFDWTFMWGEPGLRLLDGLQVTLELSVCALCGGLLLGVVFGMVRWLDWRVTAPACWLYVELARNTPPVVQIMFWYFSASWILPTALFLQLRDTGLEFVAAAFALALYHGAFYAEILRAGLNAVPKGQYEAARVLGIRMPRTIATIVLPQMGPIIVPALINETVALIKNTSLAMAIGVTELTFQYRYIDSYDFRGTEALVAVTVLYMIICCLASAGGHRLDSLFSRRRTAPLPAARQEQA